MNKDTEFVMYIDNFLSPQSLFSLQNEMMKITEYKKTSDDDGYTFGWRYNYDYDFNEKHNGLLNDIKHVFFPHRNLVPMQVSANIRSQNNVAEGGSPLFHKDTYGDNVANFLFYVKGEPLFNNGTGFLNQNKLTSSIGFLENRALFFNGLQVEHGDLQAFGNSTMRYTLNIFYREE